MSKRWIDNIPAYFEGYMDWVVEDEITLALHNTWKELTEAVDLLGKDKGSFTYQEGKWTVNELLLHLIDTERIFQYRALCIARGEMNELPGFDHNAYVKNSKANNRTMESIMVEFDSVRKASVILFENLEEDRLKYRGMANGLVMQPVQYGFLISGHVRHHLQVLKNLYM